MQHNVFLKGVRDLEIVLQNPLMLRISGKNSDYRTQVKVFGIGQPIVLNPSIN